MFLRIIHGTLKPGTWADFEHAYKLATADAGGIEGLCGRWLTRDLDDPDAGTTISLWATQAAMEAYEASDLLKKKINPRLSPFFSGEYRTTKSQVRFAEGDPAPNEWTGSDS
jgi:heme-degrading monooxygenase HmoA